MPRYKVAITRPTGDGREQCEIGNWLVKAALEAATDPELANVDLVEPIHRQQCPTDVARNQIIAWCQRNAVDIVFMVDTDATPPKGFFKAAVKFLMSHNGPAAIACPYTCGGEFERVNVFQYGALRNGPDPQFKLLPVSREEAARRTGVERVDNCGTHCIAYRLDAFARVRKPYFRYTLDAAGEAVLETEECNLHRRLHWSNVSVPLYVAWDYWANHWKVAELKKPEIMTREAIEPRVMEQARAEARRDTQQPPPADVPGWAIGIEHLYTTVIDGLHEGGTFVEVGSWCGQSTIYAAREIIRLRRDVALYAVDTFKGSPDEPNQQEMVKAAGGSVRKLFDGHLARYGVADRVHVLEGESVQVAATWPDDSVDFVFLDAAHDEQSVAADIKAWLPKVRPGGILAGHDWEWTTVQAGVFLGLSGARIEIDGNCWVFRKPTGEAS